MSIANNVYCNAICRFVTNFSVIYQPFRVFERIVLVVQWENARRIT